MKKNVIFKVFISFLVIVIIVIFLLLFYKKKDFSLQIVLYGNEIVNIYQGETYQEMGYSVIKDIKDDTIYNVEVIGKVNTNQLGKYILSYQIKNNNKIIAKIDREVNVIANPSSLLTLTLNGNETEFVLLNEVYQDKGACALYDSTDISNEIITNGVVNTEVIGNYKITYKLVKNNVEKEITRLVKVIDITFDKQIMYERSLININIIDEDFAYVKLPNEALEYKQAFTYPITKNGIYEFTIYNKNGATKKYSVTIDKFDNTKPTGTCSAIIKKGTTTVNIDASDDNSIFKYSYNDEIFSNNTYVINQEIYNIVIRVYDKNNNYIDITCNTKRVFDNNMDNIVLSTKVTPCNNNWTNYNKQLSKLMQEIGYKTRDAVAEAAVYLAELDYQVLYTWGGKYLNTGLNPKWGCNTQVTKEVCTKSTGSFKCLQGLDCTGYTAWAFIQAGFDKSIIRTSMQSTGLWGNFNAFKHRYTFAGNQDKVALIKPGDIVHTEGHVGMVIGTSATELKVANMRDGIRISYIKKSNGKSTNRDHDFENFVLFDDFFAMYGN